MARFFKSILLFIGLFLVSCQEGREAGDLLGQWRMVGSDTRADTILVEDTYAFKPFNDIRVKIESLTSDKLIISKNSQTWSFDKY